MKNIAATIILICTFASSSAVAETASLAEAFSDAGEKIILNEDAHSQLRLRQDTLYQGRLYKANTMLTFFDDGALVSGTLARDESFALLGSIFTFSSGTVINYHNNSSLMSGTLKNTVSVAAPYSITLSPGSVSFHASGGLAYGKLASGVAVKVGNSEPVIKAGTNVKFYDFDHMGRVSIQSTPNLSGGFKYLNYEALNPTPVSFYPGKSIRSAGPVAGFKTKYSTLEQGFTAASGTFVGLFLDGRLRSFDLGDSLTIGEMKLLRGESIRLYGNGRLYQWVPSRSVKIGAKTYPAFSVISFDPTGEIK